MAAPADEFDEIARLWRPLAAGAPEALDLKDDAAALPPRPGFDLVVTTDAIVEGVHFLAGEAAEDIARRLVRANLSDLAAKGAEPYGCLLAIAWPEGFDAEARSRFAAAFGEHLSAFGLKLFGGDTVSTPGPLTASLTAFGWVPAGRMVRRGGARTGDVVLVSGTIGDAGLGLLALTEGLAGASEAGTAALVARHRQPEPRLALRDALLAHATAAADVSDGLLADAGHIGEASGLGVSLRLEDVPLSAPARAWLAHQDDEAAARAWLASAGDDYEIVCTCAPSVVEPFVAEAKAAGVPLTVVGDAVSSPSAQVTFHGTPIRPARSGWAHPM